MVSAWWLMTAFFAGATVSGVWFWLQDYLDRTFGLSSSPSGGLVPSGEIGTGVPKQDVDGGLLLEINATD
jgi:hypothetical protein